MRVNGITFPGRWRFTHDAGSGYRHYIEATLFGLPILKINEHYLDGVSRMELPFGVVENDPSVNQGANLALWAEAVWFPALLATDPRAEWDPIDDHTALLTVPFGEERERIVMRFDPETGLIRLAEAMRFKGEASSEKTLWINEALRWGRVDGYLLPVSAAVTWFDEGSPWAIFELESAVYNPEIKSYIRATGP
jgi:hypothetical protein